MSGIVFDRNIEKSKDKSLCRFFLCLCARSNNPIRWVSIITTSSYVYLCNGMNVNIYLRERDRQTASKGVTVKSISILRCGIVTFLLWITLQNHKGKFCLSHNVLLNVHAALHSTYSDYVDDDDNDNDYASNSNTISQLCADSDITIKTECIAHIHTAFSHAQQNTQRIGKFSHKVND